MKEVKKRRRKNALIVLLAMLVAVVFSGYGIVSENMLVASMAELTLEPGSKDDQVDSVVEDFGDEEYANTYVLNGGISTSKAEELLNKGYCLQYLDSWKAAGKIPQDFTPSSAKTSSSGSQSQNTTTETTKQETAKSDTSSTNTSTKAETKKYSDEEIASAWKLTTTVDATCATDGYKEYKNTLTNEKKTETIPATGQHDYQVTDSVDATCTEKGSVAYTCSVCGDSYTEETDMLEHSYEVVDQKDATCTEDGYTKYECSVCGDSYEETVKATGHDEGEWKTTKEASMFSKGSKELRCTVCGEVLDTQSIPQICPIPLAGVVAIAVAVIAVITGVVIVLRKKKKKVA